MRSKKWPFLAVPALSVVMAFAGSSSLINVPNANIKSPGLSTPNVLSPGLGETPVAQGSIKMENSGPCGTTTTVSYYGYDDNGPMLPPLNSNAEASKTEPDKNTYLVLDRQEGADSHYDYGQNFIFQGHETGKCGYITRINLDADQTHRITLMASQDVHGNTLPNFDGSTWYPFSQHLLFTTENVNVSGVYQATLDVPSKVEDLAGIMGRGAYEGIQADRNGNLILVEDLGGANGSVNTHAKQPNSFIYRFIPVNASNLMFGGKLQALQVTSLRTSTPIVFHPGQADNDIKSNDVLDLHTYGKTFSTTWITIHDTAVDGTASFNANDLAKSKSATPFKRPENGQFRPGSGFTEFIFDETGDTDNRTEAGSAYGGFGAIFRLTWGSNGAGKLSLVYNGDQTHAGFDNCAFWSKDSIVFVEDAGDTLHTQRNALDSAWLFDLNTNYANSANQPIRILAQGRDPSATIDSGLLGTTGFQNEGDNEITGFHVSNGDPGVQGLLGEKEPKPFKDNWRVFYTQQHGDNFTWEIISTRKNNGQGDDNDDQN
jgi:hypothetical protein